MIESPWLIVEKVIFLFRIHNHQHLSHHTMKGKENLFPFFKPLWWWLKMENINQTYKKIFQQCNQKIFIPLESKKFYSLRIKKIFFSWNSRSTSKSLFKQFSVSKITSSFSKKTYLLLKLLKNSSNLKAPLSQRIFDLFSRADLVLFLIFIF